MKSLLQSRKFLLLCLDTVVSLILLVAGMYFPQYLDAIKQFVLILQPVFVAIIAGIAYEDAALKKSGEFEGYLENRRIGR